MAVAKIDASKILDWPTFHSQCAVAFGFPDFYGQNMNAWVDCLSYLTEGDGMSRFVLTEGELLFIHIEHFKEFSTRLQGISSALLECTASTNQRYIESGDIPRLVLVPQ
jgi:RNAse (barnase) inhibitor barstar